LSVGAVRCTQGGLSSIQQRISHHGFDQKGDRAGKPATVELSEFVIRRHDDRWNSQSLPARSSSNPVKLFICRSTIKQAGAPIF
jgi:hypothetical protein